jgi:transcriptional regulator NrdR family protein
MNCPVCDEPGSSVYNSRKLAAEDGADATVTRYRKCSHCKTRWRTVERFEHLVTIEGQSLRAEKIKDGTFLAFGHVKVNRDPTICEASSVVERVPCSGDGCATVH